MVAMGKRPREGETPGGDDPFAADKPTPGGVTPGGEAGATPGATPGGQVNEFSMELLKFYYQQLFPYGHMVAWLSYSCDPKMDPQKRLSTKYWRKREMCFTLENDIYIRYRSFHTVAEFRTALTGRCPVKIDVGAIYNVEPKMKSTAVTFNAEEKELVFDIDITDYDDVRDCCEGGGICSECWPLMACSVKVLNHVLRNSFGLKNLLWVFSGRRGIHCWVSDPHAVKFTRRVRTALIKFLETHVGNDKTDIQVDLINRRDEYRVHNYYEECYEICYPIFIESILKGRNLFMKKRRIPKGTKPDKELEGYGITMLRMIRIPQIATELMNKMNQAVDQNEPIDSMDLWELLQAEFEKFTKTYQIAPKTANDSKVNANAKFNFSTKCWNFNGKYDVPPGQVGSFMKTNMYEIVFSYVFPRVDVEVTKGVNHLLKAPFCVHPKTGKLCIPMDAEEIDTFDPNNQPTLRTLHDELIKTGNPKDTAMGKAIEIFERTFLDGLRQSVDRLGHAMDED